LLLAAVLAASPLVAQSPAGPDLSINALHEGQQFLLELACRPDGQCAGFWQYVFDYSGDWLAVTGLPPAGGVLEEKILRFDNGVSSLAAIGLRRSWTLLWSQYGPTGSTFELLKQGFDHQFEPLEIPALLPVPGVAEVGLVQMALVPGGLAWASTGSDLAEPRSSGVFLALVEGDNPLGQRVVNVAERPEFSQYHSGLAVARKAGWIAVTFNQVLTRDPRVFNPTDVMLRRFTFSGEPLGPSVRVNQFTNGDQWKADIASTTTGNSVVVWESDGQDGSRYGVYGQRFDATGNRVGPEFRVNQTTRSDQRFPAVKMDEAGNFLVVWSNWDGSFFNFNRWDVFARLYRANGEPVGPEIVVNQARDNDQEEMRMAYAHNGTFVVGWEGYSQFDSNSEEDVFVRRISASPGDEPCVVSQGTLRCDTGRTGGELEVTHPFGRSSEGPVMLGDVDGDGRADPCEWWSGRFRCDTDHEGGEAEVRIGLQGSGMPLLGDVDGDGRADPCLYTTGRFACDTAHNGKTPEKVILFGKAGETPLLGDLNGDGRDDACGWAAGVFRCETKNNGGAPEVVLSFGQSGDQPLLGDFDGDGDDDPCVYRAGQLLCDTAHNGGAAEGALTFGQPGDRVVLGNLDGL
jgi:hypothetical protein